MTTLTDPEMEAIDLDGHDELSSLRAHYFLPTVRGANVEAGEQDGNRPALYLCGNSLGPLCKKSKQYVEEEMETWAQKAVLGHWDHLFGRPWTRCEERVGNLMADVVGAKPSEVVAMSTLTSNLHAMLASFYRPNAPLTKTQTGKPRHKIIYEAKAFPSDQYALASAVALAGFDPRTSLVPIVPRDGERTLQTADILAVLEREAATGEVGLVMMAGLQYLTGQVFDMQTITKRAHELDILVGWDLAHAFANIPMALHDWNVDFAVWCTYKYGSSGPGGIAGLFVHERWGNVGFKTKLGQETSPCPSSSAETNTEGITRMAGWWGHNKSTRFSMPDSFEAITGAAGWQVSNPSALDMSALLGSLETLSLAPALYDPSFKLDIGSAENAAKVNSIPQGEQVGMGHIMPVLKLKSKRLTTYLEKLLLTPDFLPTQAKVSIVTPRDARFRGSQLSICIPNPQSPNQQSCEASTGVEDSIDKTRSNVPPPIASTTLVARVHKNLESTKGVICDVRNPDMLRLAPLAQYSSFDDVLKAAYALKAALEEELSRQ